MFFSATRSSVRIRTLQFKSASIKLTWPQETLMAIDDFELEDDSDYGNLGIHVVVSDEVSSFN